jgi:hypothetical protein
MKIEFTLPELQYIVNALGQRSYGRIKVEQRRFLC